MKGGYNVPGTVYPAKCTRQNEPGTMYPEQLLCFMLIYPFKIVIVGFVFYSFLSSTAVNILFQECWTVLPVL